MKIKLITRVAGVLLVTAGASFGQAPDIISQPQSQTNCVGAAAMFSVEATGTGLAYQWQQAYDLVTYIDRPEGTASTLVITNIQTSDYGNYRVVITSSEGAVTSDVALLVVSGKPVLWSNTPTNWPWVTSGANISNAVIAISQTPASYQWRFNGQPLPDQTNSSIVLTNVQKMDAGNYDVVVANMCGAVASRVTVLQIAPFIKITSGPVVTDRANFFSGSWADYDNDGFIDLFVPAGPEVLNQRPVLYHNLGGTNFVKLTAAEVGDVVGARPYCCQGLWADFNNDGFLDLLEISSDSIYRYASNRLFLGRSDHTFRWVENVGENPPWASWQCSLADYDNDGAVDVLQTCWEISLNSHSALYRNLGDATFTNAWSPSGPIFDNEHGTWADYNNDGYRDLWLTGFDQQNNFVGQFYRNNGNGTFEYVTDGSIPPSPSSGPAWGDYDNDGYLDCVNGKALIHNNQGTSLTIVKNLPYEGFGRWGDYDNDGNLDLVCGYWSQTPCRFYHNEGGGVFKLVDLGSPSHDIPAGESIPIWGDYNNDGFLDLFVATRGNPTGANFLYLNSGLAGGNTNHWLIVKPRGVASNRSAIGAKVRVKATIRGNITWQMREITGAYFDDLRAHFGLGDATNVDTLRIEWPSGIVQILTNVAAGQILTVVEHQYGGASPAFAGLATVTNGVQLVITEPAAGTVYMLEASADLGSWTKLMARTSAGGTFVYNDAPSTSYPQRFYRVVVP